MTPAVNRLSAPRTGHTASARREFPGRADQVPVARRFVVDALGSCPGSADAALVVSELATNAVIHSASSPGGTFAVAVTHRVGDILLEVTDQGGPWGADADEDDLSGRGLLIVGTLARTWGVSGDESGRSVWAELAARLPSPLR